MIDAIFKVEEAVDSLTFDLIAKEVYTGAGVDPVLEFTIDDDTAPVVVNIPLPVGFGVTVMSATITLDDIPVSLERFEDGVYWFKVKMDGDETLSWGAGFMARITRILRVQNLKVDHRKKNYDEIEEAHYRWMIFQCAVWATEVGQTTKFKEYVEYLKTILPYMEEINEDYDYAR